MTTPLTITSRDQGSRLAPRHETDECYWAQFAEVQKPAREDRPHWYARKFEWTLWPFRKLHRQG